MASTQDASLMFAPESTFRTGVTPTRALELLTDPSLGWQKSVKQGQGMRVGSRVARSPRRVVTSAGGSGDFGFEALSKSQGLALQWLLGAGTSTLVSGTTYQQLFTLADQMPFCTVQESVVEAGGSIDPITFLGCTVKSFECNFANDDICNFKPSLDIGDLSTAIAYAAPSYATSQANLYHFANLSVFLGGTLTAPTTTTLASSTGATVNVRGGSVTVNHNLTDNRINASGGGRERQPTVGLRTITGKLDIEYDSTTYRDLFLSDSPVPMIVQYTAGALSTGVETLQIILPEIKFDGELVKPNGTDLIVQSMSFTALDNLSAAQPIWIATRTSDTAL